MTRLWEKYRNDFVLPRNILGQSQKGQIKVLEI